MTNESPQDAFIHPSALCETDSVGARTRIWAFAHVMAGAVIGRDCNICDYVFIEGGAVIGDRVTIKNAALIWDGVTIEDDVFVGPRVTFTNDVLPRARTLQGERHWLTPTFVRTGASLGANVTLVSGIEIGEYAFVGAGAVVTRDVAAHAMVVGNPARHAGWVCVCGFRVDEMLICGRCTRRFELEASGRLREAPA